MSKLLQLLIDRQFRQEIEAAKVPITEVEAVKRAQHRAKIAAEDVDRVARQKYGLRS